MATFKVSSVEKESKPLRKTDYEVDLVDLLGRVKPESHYKPNGLPVWAGQIHAFVGAVHMHGLLNTTL